MNYRADIALDVANEQVLWWRTHGFSAREAMLALGFSQEWSFWGEVLFVCALVWMQMRGAK